MRTATLLRALRPLQVAPDTPVFTGFHGGRLQPTVLANIIRRSAQRAGIQKTCAAHTLRHTAATWLRQATGDARLVAEYRATPTSRPLADTRTSRATSST